MNSPVSLQSLLMTLGSHTDPAPPPGPAHHEGVSWAPLSRVTSLLTTRVYNGD